MLALDAFSLQKLDLVLLGLVGDKYLLDIAHVVVFHLIISAQTPLPRIWL